MRWALPIVCLAIAGCHVPETVLLAGQSNASGVAKRNSTAEDYRMIWPTPYWYWTGLDSPNRATHRWTYLSHRYPGTHGPELEIGRVTGRPILLVTKGGSGLGVWEPGGQVHTVLRDILIESRAKVDTLVWVHGESHAGTQANVDSYRARFETVLVELRNDVGFTDTVLVYLNSDADYAYASELRAEQIAIVDADPDIRGVDPDGAEMAADMRHYTSAGYIEVGSRISEEL